MIAYKRATGDNNNDGFTDDDPYGRGSWVWGRWILFVIFVVGILLMTLLTFRINRRRTATGRAPIYGTAWMTPPSYRQDHKCQRSGYYDANGVFHKNAKAEMLQPPALDGEVARPDGPPPGFDGLAQPESAYLRPEDVPQEDIDLEFRRPAQTNFQRTTAGPSSSLETNDDEDSSVSVQMQQVRTSSKK
ncbi:related to Protein RCR2 [Nakaseomyces glabratus]|nr:related to Protein RCR2 [Nakaseomyces glabratus]SLM16282.1 related to Protein RCR2 [Nakaseomyces glabratus]